MFDQLRDLYIENGYLYIDNQKPKSNRGGENCNIEELGTVLSNLSYFGFVPDVNVLEQLKNYTSEELVHWCGETVNSLKRITAADKKMDRFVVYKNFPQEVLEKSEAEYWVAQIFMYLGAPNNWFTQDEQPRENISEKISLKVLSLASPDTISSIFKKLMNVNASWTDKQKEHVQLIVHRCYGDISQVVSSPQDVSFRENLAYFNLNLLKNRNHNIVVDTANDILRLAAVLSDGDVSLRTNTKFKSMSRFIRKTLVLGMENTNNIIGDFSMRPEQFKRLLGNLHPGDYNAPKVSSAYDDLYNKNYNTINSLMDNGIKNGDKSVFSVLKSYPGQFVRRLHKVYSVFGSEAVLEFVSIIPKLETIQLLKLKGYLNTINERTTLSYTPNGIWSKRQIVTNNKVKIADADIIQLITSISDEIKERINDKFVDGVSVDGLVKNIKIQSNNQKLAPYGRGTVFPLPDNTKFIRSASYWEHKVDGSNTWFDNGWNFFDANWKSVGSVCWIDVTYGDGAAVFSGDPTNSKDLHGRACQMIDLYPEKLKNHGVRYAVWNILCYSNVPFSEAEDVLGTLQCGEHAEHGNLFEPSRAQFVFPIKDNALSKYLAYVDLQTMEIIYLDVTLPSSVQSASYNSDKLEKHMPSIIEHINAIPSVYDIFESANKGSTKILYTDKDIKIDEETAYVFNRVNSENTFKQLDIENIIG